jgi:putative sigma-54 modulation protein
MKCNIRGDKLEITDAIRDYIEEKIGRINKYFKSEELISNVLVKVRGNKDIIEVTIPTDKYILRSEVANDDLYAAIDLASEKLERQIRKNKTKLQKRINESLNKEFNFDYEIEANIEEEEKEKTIVKRKSIETKPMDEEEAILEMELLGHDFFVYKDMHSESICILYKRKDGNYGLIETE